MSLVVYTCVVGGIKDTLRRPKNAPSGVFFHAYTDRYGDDETANGWKLFPPRWELADKRRQARKHKVLSHVLYPDTDAVLWVDGCLTPKTDVLAMINRYLSRYDLAVFKHMQRNCVYQELEACIKLHKDNPELMRAQIARYRSEGYPHHNGLAETTALLRRHTPAVQAFNELWWQEIDQGSCRDQLSFDYVAWRLQLEYGHLAGTRTKSPYFDWRNHL